MNQYRLMRLSLAALILAAGVAVAAAREPYAVQVNRFGFNPGETVRVAVPARTAQPPVLHTPQGELPFFRTQDHMWRALYAVPIHAEAGELVLDVRGARPRRAAVPDPVRITVLAPERVTETITLPPDKQHLERPALRAAESAEIIAVIRRSTDDAHQAWEGLFAQPVPGRVISPFGNIRRRAGGPGFHRGVDFSGRKGDPIIAPADGRVVMVKEFAIHGHTVVLSHGQGVASLYLHLDTFAVEDGAVVARGETIGTVGSTGYSTGPHLHWGIYVHGAPAEPLQWLSEAF